MVHASTTPASEVLTIIGWLTERKTVYQVNGGWGVDALVGRQTREHGDLDVFVDADVMPDLIEWLASRGYEPVTDWLPIRIELASEHGRVDVHPWSSGPTGMVSNKALRTRYSHIRPSPARGDRSTGCRSSSARPSGCVS